MPLSLRATILLGLVTGCSYASTAGRSTATSLSSANGDTPLAALYDYGESFGTTRLAIATHLGPPLAIRSSVERNSLDSLALDSLFVMGYPELRFWLTRTASMSEDLLLNVELTGPSYLLPGGLRIGTPLPPDTWKRWSPPDRQFVAGDTLQLHFQRPGEEAASFIILDIVRDTLRRVVWAPYSG